MKNLWMGGKTKMNMTDVQCFLKVVELMSFSKASEALYISQQAVSLHIKHLEETYGVRLFERKPALRLTPEGKLLLTAARDIIDRENVLIDMFTVSQKDFSGEIAIGLPPNRSTAFACEFIPYFSDRYPNITVRLVEATSSQLPTAVKDNQIDLALPLVSQYSQQIDTSVFCAKALETESLYVIISDNLLRRRFGEKADEVNRTFSKGASLYDFAEFPMFLHPSSSHLHQSILDSYQDKGYHPFIRIKTTLTSSLLNLCAGDQGIFFSNPMLLKYLYTTQPSSFKNLHVYPILEYQKARQTMLIYHKNKHLSRPLTDSIDIIQELYRFHKSIMKKILR
jgi:DNA-binding transcriptional LysR family regulator